MSADRNPVAVQFGKNLLACRARARLSRKDLIFRASLSGSELRAFERGEYEPRLGEIVRLAKAHSIPVEDLLAGIEWEPGGREGGRFYLPNLAIHSVVKPPARLALADTAAIVVGLLFVVVLALSLVLARGSSGDSTTLDPIVDTVSAYVDAVARGKGKEACDLMTERARHSVLMGAKHKYPGLEPTSCADAYSKAGKEPKILGPFYKELLLATPPTVLEIGGGKATAEQFRIGLSSLFRLTKSGDRWLISEGLDLWERRSLAHE
ncbi:MAG TPA: helix-turn-helix transcriptional regulator [Solirubrobacterales bacterium]|nr:helix-turn-helix transcriptional regulator [Solirubrobacterales bacterium]